MPRSDDDDDLIGTGDGRKVGKKHNSGGIAADQLKSFVERIERLEEEKTGIQGDIKEVYAEAKGTGYDTKIIRQAIRLRKMEKADRQEQKALLELYLEALGMDE